MKLFNSKTIILFFFVAYCTCNIYSCAAIQAPPGGPKDNTPPTLLFSIPSSGATNLSLKKVELVFSEYLLEKSVASSISILPKTFSPISVQYKGKKLIISLPDDLLDNQTYILLINRDLKDENGVSIDEGIQLAFSTGDIIDTSELSGRIFSDGEASCLLWKIKDSTDQSDFFKRLPDYSIDANDKGVYKFNYLSNGSYKVLGVERSESGSLIDPNSSIYGVPFFKRIQIDSSNSVVNNINIFFPEFSRSASVVNGKWVNDKTGVITFDNPIDDFEKSILVSVKYGDNDIQAKTFLDNKDSKIVHFSLEDSIGADIKTLINVESVFENGIMVIDSAVVSARTKSSQDTTYLKINNYSTGSTLKIEEEIINPFDIYFSKIIYEENIDNAFSLLKDSSIIDFNLVQISPMHYQINPVKNWLPETEYSINIIRENFKLNNSRSIKDSTMIIKFKTSKSEQFGSLIGDVVSPHPNSIVARLKSLEKASYFYDAYVNSNSSFKINKIPEGIYSLMFYQDLDKINKYSFGHLSPYQSSEWFEIRSDTISIRSNWDMEVAKINLSEK
jgi:hypothetical protein